MSVHPDGQVALVSAAVRASGAPSPARRRPTAPIPRSRTWTATPASRPRPTWTGEPPSPGRPPTRTERSSSPLTGGEMGRPSGDLVLRQKDRVVVSPCFQRLDQQRSGAASGCVQLVDDPQHTVYAEVDEAGRVVDDARHSVGGPLMRRSTESRDSLRSVAARTGEISPSPTARATRRLKRRGSSVDRRWRLDASDNTTRAQCDSHWQLPSRRSRCLQPDAERRTLCRLPVIGANPRVVDGVRLVRQSRWRR